MRRGLVRAVLQTRAARPPLPRFSSSHDVLFFSGEVPFAVCRLTEVCFAIGIDLGFDNWTNKSW